MASSRSTEAPATLVRLAAAAALHVAVSACSSQRPPWADGAMVQETYDAAAPAPNHANLPERLLAIHNRERSRFGIPPLAWDSQLARAAAAYASVLERKGRLEHSPAEDRPGQGENLWMGTRNAYSLEAMAGGWAGERKIFRAGSFPEVSASGKWQDVAHYTQMIWRGTSRVGCALHQGRSWDFLVCRYSPPGNVVGQRVP